MQANIVVNILFDEEKKIKDIEITANGKTFPLLGSAGKARELSILRAYEAREKKEVLPVFLGIGLGYAISEFLEKTKEEKTPICIVDSGEILENSEYKQQVKHLLENPRVFFIADNEPVKALPQLTRWQKEHKDLPLFPLLNSQYKRINSEYYTKLHEHITASFKFDFWAKVRKKRFQNKETKILFLASRYFLMGELVNACENLNIEHKLLIIEDDTLLQESFVTLLLQNVVEFQPDMIFTMNHLGVDRNGVVTDLLTRLELPLASWFVDNPHLVLYSYPKLSSDWLTIFTYDADNIPSLKDAGYDYAYYLPLGTNTERFHPRNAKTPYPQEWNSDVSFVGNSMVTKVAKNLNQANSPQKLMDMFKQIATVYKTSPFHSVAECIQKDFPELMPLFLEHEDLEARLNYEMLVVLETTRQYRLECFEKAMTKQTLVIGDEGWEDLFKELKRSCRQLDVLAYYDELPHFYAHSKINFNATSMQMKNAPNQRIFDIPACGAFVLTDWRSQMDGLMEGGKEIISYKDKEEIPDLIKYYLKHDSERKKIIDAGRKRVLSDHKWENRLISCIELMKKRYA